MPPKNSDILDSLRLCYGIIKDLKKEKTMDKRDNITSISIEGDGKKTVTLVACDKNGVVVETVSAQCAPEDEYNFDIGAKLCMDRLYKDYDFTPKPKRKPFNGKILVIWSEDIYDTLRVRDGKIESPVYVLRSPMRQFAEIIKR